MHYHGGPLSGPKDTMSRFWRGRHAMVSFAWPDALPVVAEACQSFTLDNGAFSAWRSGRAFDFNGFAAWVREWERHPAFDWCLIPDVIDGSEKDNDDMLLKWRNCGPARFSSVPVWHFHESMSRLQRLANQFRTVALGSSGKWPTPGAPNWWQRLAEALSNISSDGRPWCKLHGLRMLNVEIFSRCPFASADSTNAAQNAGSVSRFGQYTPPEAWQRATVIADRIEAFNSAPVYLGPELIEADGLFAGITTGAAGQLVVGNTIGGDASTPAALSTAALACE